MANSQTPSIAFQGERGAYSEVACKRYAAGYEVLPLPTFEAAFDAVTTGRAACAMVPIENSLAGRVSDIYHLIPDSGLHITREFFLPVEHQLLALPGTRLEALDRVRSHPMALDQCRDTLRKHNLAPVAAADTAGAARALADNPEPGVGVIASALAAENYGLEIILSNIEDAAHNTTRFLMMAAEPDDASPEAPHVLTSFVFQVRNIPAALYKALGGFATNGVNMTKLESYMEGGKFNATLFYADVEGHPDHPMVRLALEELSFFSSRVTILGIYEAAPERRER